MVISNILGLGWHIAMTLYLSFSKLNTPPAKDERILMNKPTSLQLDQTNCRILCTNCPDFINVETFRKYKITMIFMLCFYEVL